MGSPDGLNDGTPDGYLDGTEDGSLKGRDDGCPDGTLLDGCTVNFKVGCLLG